MLASGHAIPEGTRATHHHLEMMATAEEAWIDAAMRTAWLSTILGTEFRAQ